MITIYTGQTKRFPTDLSNLISVPISDLTGLRVVLGHSDGKGKIREWRYPTDGDYGVIRIVNDVDRTVEFWLDPDDTVNSDIGELDLEIGIQDDDPDITSYIDIGIERNAFVLERAKVYN